MNGIKSFLITVLTAYSVTVWSHDTTHVHPVITVYTAKLIGELDTDGHYEEVYEPSVANPTLIDGIPSEGYLYWGQDRDLITGGNTLEYFMKDDEVDHYLSAPETVMRGVVQEDVPSTRVFSHFYQARSGRGLNLNGIPVPGGVPSSTKAMEYFSEAIRHFSGYTEASVNRGFVNFGHSLHHVEDMSSPAHIHNDAHLTVWDREKDDYEGWFLPWRKYEDRRTQASGGFPSFIAYLAGAATIRPVTNPWIDIWGINTDDGAHSADSMVNYFHYATTYHADLQFPITEIVVDEFDPNYDYIPDFTPPPAPTGELAEMFPCGATPIAENCLHWEQDDLFALAHWRIDAVGEFHHQQTLGSSDDWWALELETNATATAQRPVPFTNRFYIEQLMQGNDSPNFFEKYILGEGYSPLGTSQVRPAQYRNNTLYGGWPVAMSANSAMIPELQAQRLLAPAVEYAAGFSQYLFDIANTPPYLKAVRATQEAWDSTDQLMLYDAEWRVETELSEHCQPGNNGRVCRENAVQMESSRNFWSNPAHLGYIHASKDVVLELEFNEPIRRITFIGLGQFDDAGSCTLTDGCIVFTPPTDSATPVYSSLEQREKGRIQVFTLPGSLFDGHKGKYTLLVKAIDKHNHRDGGAIVPGVNDTGAELDATPNTPARRNMFPVQGQADINYYPWHKEGLVTQNAQEDQANTLYSYDFETGDRNHVLLIDAAPPSATIDVDTTIN